MEIAQQPVSLKHLKGRFHMQPDGCITDRHGNPASNSELRAFPLWYRYEFMIEGIAGQYFLDRLRLFNGFKISTEQFDQEDENQVHFTELKEYVLWNTHSRDRREYALNGMALDLQAQTMQYDKLAAAKDQTGLDCLKKFYLQCFTAGSAMSVKSASGNHIAANNDASLKNGLTMSNNGLGGALQSPINPNFDLRLPFGSESNSNSYSGAGRCEEQKKRKQEHNDPEAVSKRHRGSANKKVAPQKDLAEPFQDKAIDGITRPGADAGPDAGSSSAASHAKLDSNEVGGMEIPGFGSMTVPDDFPATMDPRLLLIPGPGGVYPP
ncbi:hypothetical protein BU23DRAFT_650249 [Bimuria novae-zelandiae CBS 107.79]|uniref:Uncharacterized protein n=1 Tax=Bimuria novae-zelandiae CBS 107.79 TaxID=1447943 RepID=A0A6A5UZW4_9PLEO|nr:hypothetical protein BU23DRAFT_650249 [Bimuria novae-zelandiae CBS 107.79]